MHPADTGIPVPANCFHSQDAMLKNGLSPQLNDCLVALSTSSLFEWKTMGPVDPQSSSIVCRHDTSICMHDMTVLSVTADLRKYLKHSLFGSLWSDLKITDTL